MDEVDFTILAATSVLGDLIDKCPPAEACRDAFDRMSKATVQMCMSTTGFSSTISSSLSTRHPQPPPQSSQHHAHGQAQPQQHSADYFATHGGAPPSHSQQQQLRGQQRPKPQFDMALNDLFPGNLSQSPQSRYEGLRRRHSGTVKAEYSPEQSRATFARPSGPRMKYDISPQADTSQIDPSLLPSPQEQHASQPYLPHHQQHRQHQHPHPHPHRPQQHQHQQQQHQPQQPQQAQQQQHTKPHHSPTELLHSPPLSLPTHHQAANGAFTPFDPTLDFQLQGMDFLDGGAGFGDEPAGGAGVDLGFGLGWEGLDHDFSEGNSLDLFDGFFFGGAGG